MMRQNAAGRPEAKKVVKLVSDRGGAEREIQRHCLSENRKRQKKHSQSKPVQHFCSVAILTRKTKKDAETRKSWREES